MTIARRVLMVMLALLAAATLARGQGVVELRTAVRLGAGEALTVGRVAALSGAEAEALADVPIDAKGSTVTLDDVRRAIDAHMRVNWGRLTLRGASCSIVRSAPAASPVRARPAPAGEVAGEPEPPAPGTVRAAVVAKIAQWLNVPEADVRVEFSPADAVVLDLRTEGRTLEVRPAGDSDRVPLALALYEGERTIAARTIRVGVTVKRTVLVAAVEKRRGEVLASSDLRTEERWVGPTVVSAAMEEAIGCVTQARLEEGEIVLPRHVAPPVVVSKGEIVTVRCVSGTVVLTTRGRAMASARDGEVVLFQALDSKRTFYARMDGKGRAIVVADVLGAGDRSAGALPVRGERIGPPRAGVLEELP